jgi:hypothetical protein
MNIPDYSYNWIVDYLSGRSHSTALNGESSSSLPINASIVQGSVLGPNLFNINSSELDVSSPINCYFKYADDANLLIPSSNLHTLSDELSHHENWAKKCNLKFNPAKTAELVFRARKTLPEPPPNYGITRVSSVKILGVVVDDKLTFNDHVESTLTACNKSLFALRVMKQHGLVVKMLQLAFKATVIPKLLYAGPAWYGFASKTLLNRYEAFLRRAIKYGYYDHEGPNVETLLVKADWDLFGKVLYNSNHVMHPLLPMKREVKYSLRGSWHGRCLPEKDNRNFINRLLYLNIY